MLVGKSEGKYGADGSNAGRGDALPDLLAHHQYRAANVRKTLSVVQ
jgi:hypothetical protein